jgi:hypothetical protein
MPLSFWQLVGHVQVDDEVKCNYMYGSSFWHQSFDQNVAFGDNISGSCL